MSMISIAASPVTETRSDDASFGSVLLFCCIGLAASFALIARGIDLGAGLM